MTQWQKVETKGIAGPNSMLKKKMESNGRNVVGGKEPRHGAGVSLSGLDELAVVEA
jgi:hypothetical protein